MKVAIKNNVLTHLCPGCGHSHQIELSDKILFNNSFDSPTLSRVIEQTDYCGYIIINGAIKFLPSSKHTLRGITVELPEI